MNPSDNPVESYCLAYAASGMTPSDWAQACWSTNRILCMAVLDRIGEWPSSEPELRALQQVPM